MCIRDRMNSVIIDAKSGTSGAGRGAKVNNLYCEVNENIKAYGVATHRHTPEIEDQLSYASGEEVLLNFTPHLIPMNRGILVTAYATLKKDVSYEEVKAIYDSYYKDEKFVRVLDKDVCPETRWVEGSNYVDVNFKIDKRTNRIIMMGAMAVSYTHLSLSMNGMHYFEKPKQIRDCRKNISSY